MSSAIQNHPKGRQWEGKTRGGLLGYKIFVFFLKHFPISISYFVLRFVALYFLIFSPKAFKAIYKYYRILNYGAIRSIVKIYNNYYIFGQILLDKIALSSGFGKNFSYDFDGEEHLTELADGNTGGILIGAHVGNWEMARYLLNRFNCRFNLVMLDAEHRKIKEFLERNINNDAYNNINIIVVKDDMSHIFELNNALKNNEIICFHGDRFLAGGKTVKSVFLGRQVTLPAGPFEFAARFSVPVSYVFAMKERGNHYHFYASKAKVYDSGAKSGADEFASVLEKVIRKYPEQWFNYYDFFK